MSSKADNEKLKLIQDKCQIILGNLLREEDNKYCVDCDAKGPRWASWNLGVFLCIRCAGIHRNLGVHISKVKSVNLDTWTPEQVACLQQMGNSQARAIYEANLPENFRRPQTDSSLEAFIRAKYEQKKYIAKEWVPPPPPPPAFDIEEEKKKERERKKNKTKVTNVIEISPLPQHPTAVPRPHSAGPHSPAIQPELSKQTQQVPDSSDLLNLGDTNNSGTDIFDAFLSAPTSTAADKAPTTSVTSSSETPVSKSSVTNEETDFFNQKSVSDVNKANKMTKESILSLYGSSTVQIPATQHIAPVYGVPGGMYIGQQGFAQVGMPGYASVPAQGMNPCTTTMVKQSPFNPFPSFAAPAVIGGARYLINSRNSFMSGGTHGSVLMARGMQQMRMVNQSPFTRFRGFARPAVNEGGRNLNNSRNSFMSGGTHGSVLMARGMQQMRMVNQSPFTRFRGFARPAVNEGGRNLNNSRNSFMPGGTHGSVLMARGMQQTRMVNQSPFTRFRGFAGPAVNEGGRNLNNSRNSFMSGGTYGFVLMARGMQQTGTNMPAVYNPFASIGAPAIRQDARNQPNMWIGVSPGGRDESLLMAHGMGQVSQQMANLQISGQTWNMGVPAAPVNAPGMVISSNQTTPGVIWPPNSQNQNFSNNLWQ